MILNPTATTFARPANTTQYASGDLVANHGTAGSVTPLEFKAAPPGGGSVRIKRVRLNKSDTGVTSAAFRLHLFTTSPTVTNGDNGAFAPTTAGYLGALDVTAMTGGSDGAVGTGAPVSGNEICAQVPTASIYGLWEARGTYTPASAETFASTLEIEF